MKLHRQQLPLLATAVICALLYAAAGCLYPGFASPGVFVNFLTDNAFLGVAAVGMTFVILSGGIDLSVGAVIGLVSILAGTLISRAHLHPLLVIPLMLLLGVSLGAGMGCLIRFFDLPPFMVTLAGLFLCRGTALMVSRESVSITHPLLQRASEAALAAGGLRLPLTALIFVAVLLAAWGVATWTPFGRNAYALGGGALSASLMGLPVGRARIGIYAVSGGCSALAGIVYMLYTSSGNATAAAGLELDAIAAVVVGGTLLSGGVGHMPGTLLGVLIFGMIQTAITFQGTLSSWWTKIAVGLLLLVFIVLQRLMSAGSVRTER